MTSPSSVSQQKDDPNFSAEILSDTLVEAWRSRMPVTKQFGYLDHAAVGPLTLDANLAIGKWLTESTESGDYCWPQWSELAEETRQVSAELIGADADEIALVGSTTEGITIVAEGFPFQSGDNIVIPKGEFPANVYPWLHLENKGVELRQVEMPGTQIDLNRLNDACDNRTRIVSVSWIGFSSGFRSDPKELAEVAHNNGALFFLDAIQGVGVFPLDVKDAQIDFMAADGHKWMLGPEGAGITYIKKEHLNRLRPNIVGWNSVKDRYNFAEIKMDLIDGASRYEGGSKNHVGQIGLGASLKMLKEFGLSPNSNLIANRVLKTTESLANQISELGFPVHWPEDSKNQTGILSFEVPDQDPMIVRSELLKRKIISSCRDGKIRLAVHGYNHSKDLQPVFEYLAEVKK